MPGTGILHKRLETFARQHGVFSSPPPSGCTNMKCGANSGLFQFTTVVVVYIVWNSISMSGCIQQNYPRNETTSPASCLLFGRQIEPLRLQPKFKDGLAVIRKRCDVYVYMYMYICAYIYIYIYTYICACVYIHHIYTGAGRYSPWLRLRYRHFCFLRYRPLVFPQTW